MDLRRRELGIPFSTRKPRISPSSVRAQTTATSAIVPFVIHIFVPFRTQSAPSRRAWVRIVPGVGAGVRLGEPEAADRLPRCIAGSHAPSAPPSPSARSRTSRASPAPRPRCGHRVARLELEAGQPVRDRARPGKPVAVEVHSEEPELRELLDDLAREDPLLEPVADLREHVLPHECADRVTDRPLLLVEEGVEGEEVERVERRRLRRRCQEVPPSGRGGVIVEPGGRRGGRTTGPRLTGRRDCPYN